MLSLISTLSVLLSLVSAISTIEIHGNKFFNSSDGTQFFIKGVAYQRARKEGITYDQRFQTGYIDSLAEPSLCLRDLEYLKELGVNTVRVYQLDPTQNHDVCMDAFANYGIYVLADLSEPEMSINRENPAWDLDLYDRFTLVVDAMHSYPNVLGFYVGNEVVTTGENSGAAPFVKAAVRDVKHYMAAKNYRRIPVGYASNDDAATRMEVARYFVCEENENGQSDPDSVVDFYSLNMFEWCGYSSYATSGYRQRTIEFSQMPVPVFFSEFGCNTVTPRPFTEVEAIYGPAMLRVFSGGIVYEFFQNANGYGLVEEQGLGELTKLDDFRVVQLRLMESRPQGVTRNRGTEGGDSKGGDSKGGDSKGGDSKFNGADHSSSNSGSTNSISSNSISSSSISSSSISSSSISISSDRISCPPRGPNWSAAPNLPPRPSHEKCECLQSTLSCTISPYHAVHETRLLNEVCALTDCLRILGNGSTGRYGDFAACGMKQRISFALNLHWLQNGRAPEACDFDSRAALMFNHHHANWDTAVTSSGASCVDVMGHLLDRPLNSSSVSNYSLVAGSGDREFHQWEKQNGALSVAGGAGVLVALLVALLVVAASVYFAT